MLLLFLLLFLENPPTSSLKAKSHFVCLGRNHSRTFELLRTVARACLRAHRATKERIEMNLNNGTSRTILALGGLALTLSLAHGASAAPPPHAPAHGYRAKKGT